MSDEPTAILAVFCFLGVFMALQSKQVDMTQGSLWKKIIAFAIPIALTNLVSQLFNSADVAVVGQFCGSDCIAAVGANSPVINLIVNLFFGLSVGANVFIAEHLGRGDKQNVNKAVHTSVLVALISGLIITVVGLIIARPVLRLIAVPENILDMAVTYITIYFLGMPFIMLYYFENAIFRSMGDSRTPLIVLVIAGIINIGLNIMFVAGFGMDVDGVAIATVASNVVSAVVLFIMLCKRTDEFKIEFRKMKIHGFILKKFITVGVPAGLQGAVFSISNVIIQSAMNTLGSTAVAASTSAFYFEMYCYCFANAFGHAATTFVGQNWGAQNFRRCRQSTRICMTYGIGMTLILGIVFVLFPSFFISIYTGDPQVIEMATLRLQIIVIFMWMNAVDDITVNSLRVYGRTIMPTLIYIVTICGVRIGWVYTIFAADHTYAKICMVYPVSWIVSNIAILTAYFICIRKMGKKVGGGTAPLPQEG